VALDGPSLGKMLDDVAAGRIQLPDFQREWKWDDDRIRALLATVTLDYPLGVAMTLETGGEAQFKARPSPVPRSVRAKHRSSFCWMGSSG
jgi:uncharacterized protein with ParB-like and HNH nuclease domain